MLLVSIKLSIIHFTYRLILALFIIIVHYVLSTETERNGTEQEKFYFMRFQRLSQTTD